MKRKHLRSKNLTEKERFILETFPINELYRAGFFKSKDLKHVEERICQFFGLKNIFMYRYIGNPKSIPVKADVRTFSIN